MSRMNVHSQAAKQAGIQVASTRKLYSEAYMATCLSKYNTEFACIKVPQRT